MSEGFSTPKKSLGQNFLQDPNIIRRIVAALDIHDDDVVMEIGPGRGALTELILPLAKHCHVVEFDRELSAYWQQRSMHLSNLTVHAQDILKFNVQQLLDGADQPIKVISNLPYNISSPVLFYLMPFARQIRCQVVMLQKQVVDRMASGPGNKQYGRLSVMLQQRYQIEALFKVPASAFFPPPKVESAIACLTPYDTPPHPVSDQGNFEKVVKQAFSQRRKTLRNTLKDLFDTEQIEDANIDPGARAETLSIADFARLSNLLSERELLPDIA